MLDAWELPSTSLPEFAQWLPPVGEKEIFIYVNIY